MSHRREARSLDSGDGGDCAGQARLAKFVKTFLDAQRA
jgi:hypothetical protein